MSLKNLTDEELLEYYRLYSSMIKQSKRCELVKMYSFDVKFAYHTVRLVLEVEQILTEGTLDLRRHAALLKAIRAGGWSEEQVRAWFNAKEQALEPLYHSSTLPYKPDESKIKELLLNCLEQHYGSLSDAIIKPKSTQNLIDEIENVLPGYKT